jgi:enoyl-[acyl-carrier protein] reductase II
MITGLTKLLGIEYPIIQGGMVYIGKPPLSSAVSNAGGLGVIAAGGMTPIELTRVIEEMRRLTAKPFGVNIPMLANHLDELVQVALAKQVSAVVFSAGKPDKYLNDFKNQGIKILAVVPNVSIAVKMDKAGVDAVIASGYEGGGHIGNDEITTLALIPQVVNAVKIPVIAAGGIADSRGFTAALALGAQGVQMGTAFAVTKESPAHPSYKKAVLAATDRSTAVMGRGYNPFRGLFNELSRQMQEAEKEGKSPQEILQFLGTGRNELGLLKGDLEAGTLGCGQAAGLIQEEKTVQEVIAEIVFGTERIIRRLQTACEVESP